MERVVDVEASSGRYEGAKIELSGKQPRRMVGPLGWRRKTLFPRSQA
jgi:hypothetical protein